MLPGLDVKSEISALLKPSPRSQYKVRNGRVLARILSAAILLAGAVWGASAQTAALPGAPDSLKFAVLTDTHATGSQRQYEMARVMAAVHARFPFEFVMMVGDNISGGHTPKDFVEKFEKPNDPLLRSGVTFYATLGNHDDPAIRLYPAWHMGGERYYSFVRKNVRFVVLDTNQMDPAQLGWVEDVLNDSREDWKLGFSHHPLYSNAKRHGPHGGVRRLLEPIVVKYSVNAMFSGHAHVYERLTPQQGIWYFSSGAGGRLRRGDVEPSATTAAHFDQDFSFMVIEVTGDELVFETIARKGNTVDSGVIRRRLAH
jgi:hypothetical protein